MKKIFAIAFLMFSLPCFSQDTIGVIKVDSIKSDIAEVKPFSLPTPESPDGGKEMREFILKNFMVSKDAIEGGYCGTIIVSFIVDIDGSLKDVKLYRGIDGCPDCNKEALRVVKMIPKFVPATKDGIPYKVQVYLPINFRLK